MRRCTQRLSCGRRRSAASMSRAASVTLVPCASVVARLRLTLRVGSASGRTRVSCGSSSPHLSVPPLPAMRRCIQRLSCSRRGAAVGVSGGVGGGALITAPPKPSATLQSRRARSLSLRLFLARASRRASVSRPPRGWASHCARVPRGFLSFAIRPAAAGPEALWSAPLVRPAVGQCSGTVCDACGEALNTAPRYAAGDALRRCAHGS